MNTQAKTDFSDWLVASDIDGTLNNKLRRLPKRNYERIRAGEERAFHACFGAEYQLHACAV